MKKFYNLWGCVRVCSLVRNTDNMICRYKAHLSFSRRYHEQDEELKRLRSYHAKKVEESGKADKSMW